MDCSTLGFPVHHKLPDFAQTLVHQVGDTIQPASLVTALNTIVFFSISIAFCVPFTEPVVHSTT